MAVVSMKIAVFRGTVLCSLVASNVKLWGVRVWRWWVWRLWYSEVQCYVVW